MSVTVFIHYRGSNGSARRFAQEMLASGTVEGIHREDGNERYDYYVPLEDAETVLLIDRWRDQRALDLHHASPYMARIAALREKYDLRMTVERFRTEEDAPPSKDEAFIRK